MQNWVYGKHNDLVHGSHPRHSLGQRLGTVGRRETLGAKRGLLAVHKRDTSGLTGPCDTLAEFGRDPRSVGILLSSTAGVLSLLTDSGMTLRLLLFLRDCRETEPLGSLTSSNCEIVVEPETRAPREQSHVVRQGLAP
jgi:hypothetical protein